MVTMYITWRDKQPDLERLSTSEPGDVVHSSSTSNDNSEYTISSLLDTLSPPRLKKRGLDTSNMANFRPVSNLTFMSKVVERAVTKQLNEYLIANDLLPRYQSAFRKQHSMETAMLRVLSDALTAADSRNFGLVDAVLRWFTSFVTGRTQQILFDSHLSPVMPVLYGVPQGSVLGPLLFVMYTAHLSRVVMHHGLLLHQYADDCQVYLSSTVNDASSWLL